MKSRFPACIRDTVDELPMISGKHGQWVPFTQAIPDDEDDYLFSNGRWVISGLWQFDGIHYANPNDDCDPESFDSLTHWMKYPEPPQG